MRYSDSGGFRRPFEQEYGGQRRFQRDEPRHDQQRFDQQRFDPRGMRPRSNEQEDSAPIVKVIEVLAQSPHGWEDAARRAVAQASRTVDDIKSIYVSEMQAIVEDGEIVQFRLNAKISFAIHGDGRNGRQQRSY